MNNLKRYSHHVTLNDGVEVTLHSITKGNGNGLIDLFAALPPEDRYYFRDGLTNTDLIANCLNNVNFDVMLPIVATYRDQIVGAIVLQRCRFGWRRYLGNVWVVLAKEFEQQSLETLLVKEVITLAPDLGLEKLIAEIPVRVEAVRVINALSTCGFNRLCVLEDIVKDYHGRYKSLMLMGYDVLQ